MLCHSFFKKITVDYERLAIFQVVPGALFQAVYYPNWINRAMAGHGKKRRFFGVAADPTVQFTSDDAAKPRSIAGLGIVNLIPKKNPHIRHLDIAPTELEFMAITRCYKYGAPTEFKKEKAGGVGLRPS